MLECESRHYPVKYRARDQTVSVSVCDVCDDISTHEQLEQPGTDGEDDGCTCTTCQSTDATEYENRNIEMAMI